MNKDDWRKCLICGNSKDVIKRIPDNSIDFIFTDPPYNIGKHSTGNIPLPGRTPMNNDVAKWDWEDFHPEEWAEEFIRILKPTGNLFIFTSYNQIGKWYDSLDHKFDTTNFMIWHKTNPAPKIFKAGFLNSCEMIFTCWNKKHTWNFLSQREMHNFYESPICMRPERLSSPKHPAQKPIALLKKIITIASNEGDIIFDPFMGVGSTGVAAMQLGRKFIGVEIENDYFSAAKKRIEEEMNKTTEEFLNFAKENTAVPYKENIVGNSLITLLSNSSIDKDESFHKISSVLPDDNDGVPLKPLLKWAGGKEKELKYIIPNMPSEIKNYYEPFVGGGSVFLSVKGAECYYVNDFSSELISLYRNISEKNMDFFGYSLAIDEAWNKVDIFFSKHSSLIELYKRFRQNGVSAETLKELIKIFAEDTRQQQLDILGVFADLDSIEFLSEINKNLYRKMLRMKDLELKKGLLSEADVSENIRTAMKSALYMYFRSLYNDDKKIKEDSTLHCALFLFIRNYCYSGMFRYNDKGNFNVPYGGMGYNKKTLEKKLSYYRSEALLQRLSKAKIYNLDFEDFLRLNNPGKDDFIFLDPPYDSEFSTYAKNEFSKADQERLANFMICECKAKWMLVIKNTDFIFNLYNKDGVNIRTFDKQYNVSFMNRNNRKTTHLLITNY